MDKEERKQYNKVYYSVNKDRILADLCQKVQCEYCGRTVIKNNILIIKVNKFFKREDYLTRLNEPKNETNRDYAIKSELIQNAAKEEFN